MTYICAFLLEYFLNARFNNLNAGKCYSSRVLTRIEARVETLVELAFTFIWNFLIQ